MGKIEKIKFDFDDIILVPSRRSAVNSRKQVNPFDLYNMLPLFTAPMDSVVNEDNSDIFKLNKIYSIIPRNLRSVDTSVTPYKWYSYGLEEFKNIFLSTKLTVVENPQAKFYALIDIAQGHINDIYQIAKKAKILYGDSLVLMVGNIANPETYYDYAKIEVDYVRCGIGNGNACLTSENCGVGYPMGSLISEVYKIKGENEFSSKIIADGGFKKYADIIKALALGADYVMLGSIFAKAFESASELYTQEAFSPFYTKFDIEKYKDFFHSEESCFGTEFNFNLLKKTTSLYKKFRGMSSKEVQKEWGKEKINTSEGTITYLPVEYKLSQWCENFEHYLRSAMAYCNSFTLYEFKGSDYELITQNAFQRFNK